MSKNSLLTREERKALRGGWYKIYSKTNDKYTNTPYEVIVQGVLDRIRNDPFSRRLYFTSISRHEFIKCIFACDHDFCNKWKDRSLVQKSLIQPSWRELQRDNLEDGGIALKHKTANIEVLLYPPSPHPPWQPATNG